MCRIIGQINSNAEKPEVQIFKRLTELSKAGGPDNTSFFIDDQVIFGFNRLSILDLSPNGNQPIQTPSGKFVIMMNGEIYNYQSLSKEFHLNGLRSTSDSEVLCQLIDKLGFENTISVLNGMFAISCWDIEKEILWLARDFAGIKPLFFSVTNKGLIFASQFDQIFKHPWLKSYNWNYSGLQTYFRLGFMKSPDTIVENINSLEPGQILKYTKQENQVEKVFYKQFFKENVKSKYKETCLNTVKLVESTFEEAVSDQLVSDVPVGVFLSGGIDSALVAAVTSKLNPSIESLTIGFEDKKFDESQYAKAYANELKIKNKNYMISSNLAHDLINKHNENLTEPLADFSSLPMYFASNIASSHYKVMLSGDGGDEMFWGYPRYQSLCNARYLYKLPSENLRRKIGNILFSTDVVGKLKLSSNSIGEANFKSSQLLSENEIIDLMKSREFDFLEINEFFKLDSVSRTEILNYFQRNDFYGFLQKVLAKVDRNSMSNSLEVRVPFLDKRLINLIEEIQPQLGKNKDTLKYITKKILSKYIDHNTIQKSKMGFTPPIKSWVVDFLKSEIDDLILSKSPSTIQLDYNYLGIQWERIKNNSNHDLNIIWSYYVLAKFLERMNNIEVQ